MFLHCANKPPGSPPTQAPWTWIWRSSSQRFRHQVGCHRPRPAIARTAPGRFHWDFFGEFWISLIIWLPGTQTCRIWYEYYLIYLFMTFTIQTIRFFAMMIWCLYGGALAAYMMDMITFFYDISQCFIHIISIWFLESVVRSQTYSQLYSKLHTMG